MNTTDGSRWIVKAQPTKPPTGHSPNTPNGSWGIFKILPAFPQIQGRILTFPQLPLGAFQREQEPVVVGWNLIFHRLPSVVFKAAATALLVFQQPVRTHGPFGYSG